MVVILWLYSNSIFKKFHCKGHNLVISLGKYLTAV